MYVARRLGYVVGCYMQSKSVFLPFSMKRFTRCFFYQFQRPKETFCDRISKRYEINDDGQRQTTSLTGNSSDDNVYDGKTQEVIPPPPPPLDLYMTFLNKLKWVATFTGVFVHDLEMTKNRFSHMFF